MEVTASNQPEYCIHADMPNFGLGRIRSTLILDCCLILIVLSIGIHSSDAQSPRSSSHALITSLRPDVVFSGKRTAQITIRGVKLKDLRSVQITDCDMNRVMRKINHSATLTVDLPASVLARPCVLRISPESNPGASLPLAVADSQIARIVSRLPDNREYRAWSGVLNRLYDEDIVGALGIPRNAVMVQITDDDQLQRDFVLGKHQFVVERLKAMPSPTATRKGINVFYLFLVGVDEDDVQWGPKDVEDLWIGMLSADRKHIENWQSLADMVSEPSGPLDSER